MTLAWPLFWGAYAKQDPTVLNKWLATWRFGDDGATILISPQAANEDLGRKGRPPVSFSLVPLLLVAGEIPADARRALIEGRRQDAAKVLMREYDLSCKETGDLLDVPAC